MKKTVLLLTIISVLTMSSISAYEFCENGQMGEQLRIISFDDMLKSNTNEWLWQPGQLIEIEARVQNRAEESATYVLEIIAIDENENEIILFDKKNKLTEKISMESKERKSIAFEFYPNENINAGEYQLFAKLYKHNEEGSQCVENSQVKVKLEKIDFCKDGSVDKSDLEISMITDEKNGNEKMWEWSPAEKIGINLKLENKNYPRTQFKVELIMLNDENEIIKLSKKPEEIIRSIEIDKNREGEIRFSFELDSSIKNGLYTLYAKAYDEDDDSICTTTKAEKTSNPKTITIQRENRKIRLFELIGPKTANQSENIEYQLKASNLGSKDEEKISITIYNYDLNIKETKETGLIKSGESETVKFNIQLPENASLQMHRMLFFAQYEYNERLNFYKSQTSQGEELMAYLTILEKQEVQKIEQLENNTNEIIEGEVENFESAVTGRVIESKSKSNNAIFLLFLALAAAGGIAFLIIKKPDFPNINLTKIKGFQREPKITQPNIIRTYKARL